MWARPFFLTFLFYLTSPTTANVLFLPRGHLYASYDHWTLHIPIETRTSWTFVLKLEHHVKLFKSKVSSIFAEHRQQLRSDQASQLFTKFNQDVSVLDHEMNLTKSILRHLQVPHPHRPNRNRRSVLPFIGDALSSLFGTATDDEIQEVISRMNELSASQNDILNVFDNTVTVVNQTLVEIDTDRQTINRLANVTNYLTNEIYSLRRMVEDNLSSVSELDSMLDIMFADLLNAIQDFRRSVINMEIIFSFVENGIVPRSFLPPARFTVILEEIQKMLPHKLALPFAPTETDRYYSAIYTQTRRTANGLSVLINIPLMSVTDHFKVFQVFNVPVPKLLKDQTFMANYKIEKVNFVALSEDSHRFAFIDDDDMHVYLRRRLPFCPLRRPIMNTMTSSMCIPALLTNRTKDIKQFCDKVISVNVNTDPTAEYFGNGYWVVVSATIPISFDISCKDKSIINSSETLRLDDHLSLVKLDFGCTALNKYFRLPTHFRTDSYLDPVQIQHVNMSLALNDVWSNVLVDLSETNVSLPEAVNFIPPLQDKSVHLSNLKKHIQQIRVRNAQHNKTVVIPAISVTTCIVVALVLLTVLYVRCHVFKPIMIRPQQVSAQNPAPDSVIVEETSSVAPNIKPREKLTDPSPSCLQWLKPSPTLASQKSADA
ncbi:uncharacterized protein LOC122393876 [Amphibalanus amphitrite]|uniref:uncharacterized protein LOC122393876 n=1 Tax=Amphibalanus amphitrite TaxID=1232801 RepID=UPI001C900992|nr:uncharacterized protein LOC122393876 [Amphibalanus amphitrite]